jgi:hypothetical protein
MGKACGFIEKKPAGISLTNMKISYVKALS